LRSRHNKQSDSSTDRRSCAFRRNRHPLLRDYDGVVDWRTALRKFVNREDRLGPVRLALLRVIDPVEWYMAKNDEERRRSHRKGRTGASGWTGYAPLEHEPSGARVEAPSIRVPPPVETREDADRHFSEFWSRHDAMRREHKSYFEDRSKDLLADQEATVETTKGTIRARLARFRNGAVFEYRISSRWGSGHIMTRIERRHLSNPIPMLVNCLVEAVLRLGLDAQPVE
jgi:hypothetical protein